MSNSEKLVYFENVYKDIDERGNIFVCIDGYPIDENAEGKVVATVYLTPHRDIVVVWHDNLYCLNTTVVALVEETILNLKP